MKKLLNEQSLPKVPVRSIDSAPEVKIRRLVVREFGMDFPPTAQVLIDWAVSRGKHNSWLNFSVPELPPSVNKLYATIGTRRILSKDGVAFKRIVAAAIGSKKATWKPKGAVMVLIFLQSPFWITKKDMMRNMDGDNRVKALLDAIQECTGVPDYTNWEFHCYKAASSQVRTSAYLFDLGDVVQWFP